MVTGGRKRQSWSMTATPLPGPPGADDSSSGGQPSAGPPAWQAAPPAGAPEPAYPHLRRSTANKVLGGVCGGLAEYTGTDPLLWRVGFIALAVMGAGILIYPLLWLLVPSAGPGDSAMSGVHETLRKGRAPRS
jgi:phage shock protein PspC (stress-responsive transcriptional regulator)